MNIDNTIEGENYHEKESGKQRMNQLQFWWCKTLLFFWIYDLNQGAHYDGSWCSSVLNIFELDRFFYKYLINAILLGNLIGKRQIS